MNEIKTSDKKQSDIILEDILKDIATIASEELAELEKDTQDSN